MNTCNTCRLWARDGDLRDDWRNMDALVYRHDGAKFYAASPEDAEVAARHLNTLQAEALDVAKRLLRASEEPLTTADRVLLLRRWLSLSVAEAARVLHVQRPTICSWQDGKAPAAPKNLERLRTVFELAREWRTLSTTPVENYRKEPLGNGGRTLMDLLSADEVSRALVLETMKRIVEASARRRAQRPMSGAELAKRFRFQPLRDAEVVANVTRESSRGSRKNGEP